MYLGRTDLLTLYLALSGHTVELSGLHRFRDCFVPVLQPVYIRLYCNLSSLNKFTKLLTMNYVSFGHQHAAIIQTFACNHIRFVIRRSSPATRQVLLMHCATNDPLHSFCCLFSAVCEYLAAMLVWAGRREPRGPGRRWGLSMTGPVIGLTSVRRPT